MKRRYEHTREEQREKMAIDARIIVNLYDSDYSTEEIAKSVGRQKSFVYKAWHDAGLPKRLTHLQKQVLSLRNEGRSCVEIADFLGKDAKFQQMAFKQCKCCGSLFLGKNKCYCSDKCAKKVFNSIGKDKRIKKKKAVIIDRGITLEKLYERDNGICWLCGCQCDWEDYKITPDGAFVVGKNYPSEDHVVPLSKGGQHSWNNVKLAHHYCNTLKRDKVVS